MMKLSHWWYRFRRGPIVEQTGVASGTVLRYRSGYIEHIDAKTEQRTDVLLDLYRRTHRPRTWRCSRMFGGGSIDFEGTTKAQATARCVHELGPVMYVDDYHGFIFYRAESTDNSATPPAQLPQS